MPVGGARIKKLIISLRWSAGAERARMHAYTGLAFSPVRLINQEQASGIAMWT